MSRDKDGTHVQARRPNWNPLLDLAGEEMLTAFMWMAEIRLGDGSRVHAYKHIVTRRYLHLDERTRAYLYTEKGRYRRVPALGQLGIILYHWTQTDPASAPALDSIRERLRAIELLDAGPVA